VRRAAANAAVSIYPDVIEVSLPGDDAVAAATEGG